MKGKARFRPAYFLPTRLEANEALLSLKAEHARSLGGGEAGLTLAYDRIAVPEGQQEKYERFPANTLRGSLAYGYRFSDRFAVLAEAGFTSISGDEISDKVNRTHRGATYAAAVSVLGELDSNYRLGLSDQAIRDYARQLEEGGEIDLTGGTGG